MCHSEPTKIQFLIQMQMDTDSVMISSQEKMLLSLVAKQSLMPVYQSSARAQMPWKALE